VTPRLTAGKRLRRTLDHTLAEGVEWDEREQVTLDLLETAADRADSLTRVFNAEMAKPSPSPHRVSVLAAELRQTEATIAKPMASLDPQMEQAKSARHVHAANARWARRVG
jgi:hypothetical protein